ncbi:unnamed protein product [Rotaria sp. Silwood2]|nr:unnamed protein product [Rotaria sp. Silwood2]CAF2741879.1 unnamed protein product [Rotaria sp. Silwood2]CAF2999971.1 unnamed protein product [Rotaria sp. Silwood2]CAF3162836.1 unnamed protein product [Rotaria sp. Silwood2]CAF3880340.1 unnamed protein product [Rotaria sp. Silwood2]
MSTVSLSSSFNSTITQENLLISTITIPTTTTDSYDHQGAALYIAIILVWYSTGLAMMLFLQVRPRTLQQQYLFDSSSYSSRQDRLQKRTSNPFTKYQNIEADNATKQILNELKDPERRQRLWKIYYASSEKQNEPDPQYYQTITSDSATIDRIKRKLADIHRMNSTNDSNFPVQSNITSTNENRSLISAFDSTKFFSKRFPALRRPATGTTTNTRPTFIRAISQTDQPLPNITVEMEPLIDRKQSLPSTPTSSPERNTISSDRFTIEKVSDNNTMHAIVNETIE